MESTPIYTDGTDSHQSPKPFDLESGIKTVTIKNVTAETLNTNENGTNTSRNITTIGHSSPRKLMNETNIGFENEVDNSAVVISVESKRSVDSNTSTRSANMNINANNTNPYHNGDTAGTKVELGHVEDYPNGNTHVTNDHEREEEEDESNGDNLMIPLVSPNTNASMENAANGEIRSRKRSNTANSSNAISANNNSNNNNNNNDNNNNRYFHRKEKLRQCCNHADELRRHILRNTIVFMGIMAKLLFWVSLVVMAFGVFWYSKELALHG